MAASGSSFNGTGTSEQGVLYLLDKLAQNDVQIAHQAVTIFGYCQNMGILQQQLENAHQTNAHFQFRLNENEKAFAVLQKQLAGKNKNQKDKLPEISESSEAHLNQIINNALVDMKRKLETAHQAEVTLLRAQQAAIQASSESNHQAEITSLKAEIAKLSTAINHQSAALKDKYQTEADKQLAELKAEHALALKAEIDGKKALRASNTDKDNSIKLLDTGVKGRDVTIKTLKDNAVSLKKEIEEIKAALEAAKKDNKQIHANLKTSANSLAELQHEVKEKNSVIKTLTEDNSAFKVLIEEGKVARSKLTSDLSQSTGAMSLYSTIEKALTEANKALTKQNAEKNEAISSYEEQMAMLRIDLNNLNMQLYSRDVSSDSSSKPSVIKYVDQIQNIDTEMGPEAIMSISPQSLVMDQLNDSIKSARKAKLECQKITTFELIKLVNMAEYNLGNLQVQRSMDNHHIIVATKEIPAGAALLVYGGPSSTISPALSAIAHHLKHLSLENYGEDSSAVSICESEYQFAAGKERQVATANAVDTMVQVDGTYAVRLHASRDIKVGEQLGLACGRMLLLKMMKNPVIFDIEKRSIDFKDYVTKFLTLRFISPKEKSVFDTFVIRKILEDRFKADPNYIFSINDEQGEAISTISKTEFEEALAIENNSSAPFLIFKRPFLKSPVINDSNAKLLLSPVYLASSNLTHFKPNSKPKQLIKKATNVAASSVSTLRK